MKIQIASDLHFEFFSSSKAYRFKQSNILEPTNADVLVLPGDIVGAFNEISLRWFTDVCNHYPYVLYLFGNHEFYGKDFSIVKTMAGPLLVNAINERTKKNNLILLHDSHFFLEDCIFAGGILWTDFDKENPLEMLKIQQGMSDYIYIKNGEGKLLPQNILVDHRMTRAYLGSVLDHPSFEDKKKIIITHHLPSFQSTVKYPDNYLDHAFASDMDYLVAKSDIWVHGHTHVSYQYKLGNCEVHCNPFGYFRQEENEKYNPAYVIEI